jgi:hypothetical protein
MKFKKHNLKLVYEAGDFIIECSHCSFLLHLDTDKIKEALNEMPIREMMEKFGISIPQEFNSTSVGLVKECVVDNGFKLEDFCIISNDGFISYPSKKDLEIDLASILADGERVHLIICDGKHVDEEEMRSRLKVSI